MDINSIVDKLNNQLDKLNNIKNGNSINTNDFFTDDETFNDDLDLSTIKEDSSSTIVSENKR